jgi:3-hydroxyisobutyrate dehydrogenase-like beta-hydroxyacid dehydrogenase
MHVGFAGLGRMGAVMAPRFLADGHQLSVWNRTAHKAQPLAERGATIAEQPAGLRTADVVISMLGDDASVEGFYDALFAEPMPGRLAIDMSTIRPETAQRVAAKAAAAGAGFVDAPVSGTVGPARDGKLLILAGGTEDDLARARPLLKVLGRRVIHAGPVGSGALLKLVINLPLAVYWAALGEATAMGSQGGLSLPMMLDALKDSAAALAALPIKAPAILGEPGAVAFDVASMRKDMLAIIETGTRRGVPMPTAAAALGTYAAAVAGGLKDADSVAVVRFLAECMTRESRS